MIHKWMHTMSLFKLRCKLYQTGKTDTQEWNNVYVYRVLDALTRINCSLIKCAM